MASEDHKMLAQYIKKVHSTLRKASTKRGPDKAWLEHLENKDILTTYAECMKSLATNHWDVNSAKDTNTVISRIKWTADFCYDYFIEKSFLKYRDKDIDVARKINLCFDTNKDTFTNPVRLIDVGSCYNPFRDFQYLDVCAVDLCPANKTVMQCDFLNVCIGSETNVAECRVIQLQKCSFDAVTFCFLLEYIPDSKLRIKACINAYNLLKPEGLLIINTPDSKHVGANCKLMKCWRYTLACMGFHRIKYEKFKHMHCMAFRKSLHQDIAIRWSKLYKENYMNYAINIPQDFHDEAEDVTLTSTRTNDMFGDFCELPFRSDFE